MISLKRILAPMDFSETSEVAVRYAAELSKGFGATLHILHVLEQTELIEEGLGLPLSLDKDIEHEARKRLSGVLTEPQAKSLKSVEFALRAGSSATEIVSYAKEHGIDLIVMGTHGRTFVPHLLMGSVAEKVVRRAPCPILVVRHPQDEFITSAQIAEHETSAPSQA